MGTINKLKVETLKYMTQKTESTSRLQKTQKMKIGNNQDKIQSIHTITASIR